MDKVDGDGVCLNAPQGPDDPKSRHEWRHAVTRQQNAPAPQLAGAKPGPARIFLVFYCIYCLELRDAEIEAPVVAPVVVQNVLLPPAVGLGA